jgi:hypothetical protein
MLRIEITDFLSSIPDNKNIKKTAGTKLYSLQYSLHSGELKVNQQINSNSSPKTQVKSSGLIYHIYAAQEPIKLERFQFSYRGMTYNLLDRIDQNNVNPKP